MFSIANKYLPCSKIYRAVGISSTQQSWFSSTCQGAWEAKINKSNLAFDGVKTFSLSSGKRIQMTVSDFGAMILSVKSRLGGMPEEGTSNDSVPEF